MSGTRTLFAGLCVSSLIAFLGLFWATLSYAPVAQLAAGGAAQKVFYFHVPAAYALYLSGTVCLLASAAYLMKPTPERDAWAKAGAEVAALFGAVVLTSGPLWAKKAWGVYWTWEPRLTTLLLGVLVYASIVLLRRFIGEDDSSKRFMAALGVLGTINLPIVHLSVLKWGGNHPIVIGRGGGGVPQEMARVLGLGFVALTLAAALLLWLRARQALLEYRLLELEERSFLHHESMSK